MVNEELNTELYIADYASAKDSVENNLFGNDGGIIVKETTPETDVNTDNVEGVVIGNVQYLLLYKKVRI